MKSEKLTPETHLQAGNKLKKAGKIEAAIEQYKQALTLNPNYIAAQIKLAEIYDSNKKYNESIIIYKKIEKLQPENIIVKIIVKGKIAHCLLQLGKITEAINKYKTALSLEGEKPVWLYQQLGDAYVKNGQLAQAKNAYEQARELNPQNQWLYLKLANLYEKEGKGEEAIAQYQLALKINPNQAAALNKLGNIRANSSKL